MKPMLARLVRELPEGDYVYEPKWDGFRCLAERAGDAVELFSRHERPLGRYFPELTQAMAALEPERWTLDGEILVTVDGRFDFPALMGRLHPAASRVRELSGQAPARLVAFDLLAVGQEDLKSRPLSERRRRLEQLLEPVRPPLHLTPATTEPEVARGWLREFRGGGVDGVMAKACDLTYEPGRRLMLKVKTEQTAECVVAGVRAVTLEGAGKAVPEVTSLLLGLYAAGGRLEHVGVASSFSRDTRRELAEELAALVVPLDGHPWEHGFLTGGGPMGRLKGAAGRWTPEMTLDWLPLAPDRVAEVAYTQVDGHRLRHPAKLVRWRPDREPHSCRIEQLDIPAGTGAEVLEEGASAG